jgi:16S rRNA processing protein RimM
MQYFKAGKLVAVHGLKGELILKHELGKKSSLKDVKAIFIEDKKDSFFPWFIETAKARSAEEVLLKLETIDTREAAAKLSQKEIWLTEEDFKTIVCKISARPIYFGYTIINDKERLSEILEVLNNLTNCFAD